MLNLALLKTFIKQNWKIPIYLILAIIIFKFYWNIRNELKASQRREHNLKVEMIQQWVGDSLALVKKAEIIDSLEGVLLSAMGIRIKTDTIKIHTEGEKEGDIISFDYADECFESWGWLNIKPPYPIQQFIYQKPYSLEILITNLHPDIYGKITPSNSCVQIEGVKWKVAPDLKGAYRDGFDKGEFILGSALVGCGVIIYNFLK